MPTKPYMQGPITFKNSGGTEKKLAHGMGNTTLDPAIEKALVYGSGMLDPLWIGTGARKPVANGETGDWKKILQAFPTVDGLAIKGVATQSATPAKVYTYAMEETRIDPNSNHLSAQINKGLFLPGELRWAEGAAPSTMTFQLIAVSDAGQEPVIINTGEAAVDLSTELPVDVFFGGCPQINGVELDDQIIGITVRWGLTTETRHACQQATPTRSGVFRSAKQVTLTTKDVLSLSDFSMSGKELTQAALIRFQKGKEDGDRTAKGTAEHIILTINKGTLHCGQFGGDQGQSAGGEIVIDVADDLTNDPFVWDFAATLP